MMNTQNKADQKSLAIVILVLFSTLK